VKFSRLLTRLSLATLAAHVVLISAHAQECSTKTTVGRWVVVCNGYITPGANAPLTPARILAAAVADNEGTFTSGGTLSVGGAILQQTVNGTEHLNADCTGTIRYKTTINGQPAPDIHFTFVVSDRGNRIDGISSDTGSTLGCVLRRFEAPDNDR
jgi:hypothetical protein